MKSPSTLVRFSQISYYSLLLQSYFQQINTIKKFLSSHYVSKKYVKHCESMCASIYENNTVTTIYILYIEKDVGNTNKCALEENCISTYCF